MYKEFNLYFQIEDSENLVYYNDVNYNIKDNINADMDKLSEILKKNNEKFNIFYISEKKLFDKYTWISNNYNADITILKTSQYNDFNNNTFNNVILIVDDENNFLKSMIYLYNNTAGFIDFKIKNYFDKNILSDQFEILADFIIKNINEKKYKHIKQLTSFFNKEKFETFGENSVFISPKLNVYRHPISYWTKSSHFVKIEDFNFNEKYIHLSKPHTVCHNCETFYCDRNIYFNFNETTEYKVPAFTECKKTTFISVFQKHIFNKIQNNITLDEIQILDKLNDEFDAETEYFTLHNEMCLVNKIKNYYINYLQLAEDNQNWIYNLNH